MGSSLPSVLLGPLANQLGGVVGGFGRVRVDGDHDASIQPRGAHDQRQEARYGERVEVPRPLRRKCGGRASARSAGHRQVATAGANASMAVSAAIRALRASRSCLRAELICRNALDCQ